MQYYSKLGHFLLESPYIIHMVSEWVHGPYQIYLLKELKNISIFSFQSYLLMKSIV